VRQDALDDEGSLEPSWALNPRLEHIGHATTSDAFKQRVLAEWNRLRKRYPHGFAVDCISKCPIFASFPVAIFLGALQFLSASEPTRKACT
jgi:hypothetical protein